MKNLLTILAFIVSTSWAQAQTGNTVLIRFPGVPTGDCSSIMVAVDDATGDYYDCDAAGNWFKVGPGGGGGVNSVTGTPPIASSGGANPDISISQAGVATNGYLSSIDWNFFNNKQPLLSSNTCPAGDFFSAFATPDTFTCTTPAGVGFPRLDQVLDPNTDKTFDMGGFQIRFLTTATPFSSSYAFDPDQVNFQVLADGVSGQTFTALSALATDDTTGVDSNTFGASIIGRSITSVGGAGAAVTGTYTAALFDGTGTIGNAYVIYVDSVSNSGPGTLDNAFGLFVADQTGASTNYAIKTGSGQNSFGDITRGTRFSVSNGTALVSGDFALSAGWGNTASIGSIRGTDQAFSFTVTSGGAGIADSPTTTLTFQDGTWTTVPVDSCSQVGGTGIQSDISLTQSATTIVLTWLATPTAADTYAFNCTGMGI